MITADQIVAHCVGDYILQSDWMASKKRTENTAAAVHALVYTLCFLPLPPPSESAEDYIARHGGPDKVFARSEFPMFRSKVPEPGAGRGITLTDLHAFVRFDDAHRSERRAYRITGIKPPDGY